MKKIILASAIAAATLSTNMAVAASQGSVGATSQGSVNIDLIIPALIRITDLQDIDLGTYSGDGADLTGTSTGCVRRNSAGNYNITATGSTGSYALTGQAESETVAYAVEWAGTALTHGTSAGGFVADSGTLGDCTPENKLTITTTGADMDAVVPDTYSDTLTLIVAPE